MKLICDYREKHIIKKLGQIIEQGDKYKDVVCDLQNLAIGDFVIGNLIIERKTHADLASSILDGRYKEQCFRLEEYKKENPDYKILYFIEGNFDFCMNAHNINKDKLISSIFSLFYEKGFFVILTKHLNETCEFLLKFCHKYYTKYNNSLDTELTDTSNIENLIKQTRKKNTQINKDNIGIMMLCNIPNISYNVAVSLLKSYNNDIYSFISHIKNEPEFLDQFKLETKDGKLRKLNKNIAQTLKDYFLDTEENEQDIIE